MEFLIIGSIIYAVSFVLWILSAVVSGYISRWKNIIASFLLFPFVFGGLALLAVTLLAAAIVVVLFVVPLTLIFSKHMQEEFRKHMTARGF